MHRIGRSSDSVHTFRFEHPEAPKLTLKPPHSQNAAVMTRVRIESAGVRISISRFSEFSTNLISPKWKRQLEFDIPML